MLKCGQLMTKGSTKLISGASSTPFEEIVQLNNLERFLTISGNFTKDFTV